MLEMIRTRKTLRNNLQQIEALKRSSIRITAHAQDEAHVAVGASRFGGSPDLPAQFAWPRGTLHVPEPTSQFKERYPNYAYLPPDGTISIPFIAQLDLAALAAYDREQLLPKTGRLYFFYNRVGYPSDTGPSPGIKDTIHGFEYSYYDNSSSERWRVVYSPEQKTDIEPTAPPLDVPEQERFRAQELSYISEWTLPSVPTSFLTDGDYSLPSRLRLSQRETTVYHNLKYKLRANQAIHHLLGHADDIQEFGMERSYVQHRKQLFPELPQFETLSSDEQLEELTQCRLLLQISEQANGMYFGRDGRLFFYIRETDLQRQDFTRVWTEA